MKAEFDLTKMVEEIAMQAEENQEEFIFKTIQPYCENIIQMKINKKELKQILLNGIQKPKIGCWIDVETLDSALWHKCSECGETEFYATDFCPNCGAKMEVEE